MSSIVKRVILINVDAAGTAEQISATSLYVSWFEVHFPTGNAGNCFIGSSDVDSTWIPRPADTTIVYSAGSGSDTTKGDYIDLSQWFIDAANTDDDAIIEYAISTPHSS